MSHPLAAAGPYYITNNATGLNVTLTCEKIESGLGGLAGSMGGRYYDALGHLIEDSLTIAPNQTTTLQLGIEGDRFATWR